MGRAGKALKQTLETYKISQNKLAVVLNVDRAVVNRWFHEQVDPNAETVADIVKASVRLRLRHLPSAPCSLAPCLGTLEIPICTSFGNS